MNTDVLFQKIKNPYLFLQSDISLLKDLTLKYPFSQLYPILYLQTLALHKELHFDEELKNYAFKITDRAKLYDLIYSFEGNTTSSQVNSNIDSIEKKNKSEELLEIKKEEIVLITPIIEIKEIKVEIENTPEKENQIEDESEFPSLNEEIILTKAELRNNDILEQEMLSNIISSSYSLELAEKSALIDDNSDGKVDSNLIDIEKSTIKSDSENITIEEEKIVPIKIEISHERSFSSWLSLTQVEKSAELDEKTKINTVQENIEKSKIEKAKIIEEFIKTEPQISKPKTEFYSAPKKAKESLSDEKLIYSDTLANIFALQGNFPKAIKAFEQLIVCSPEKADFYQEKIKELKKKMNP